MVSAFSRILPIRSAKKQNGWKMENLPRRCREQGDEILRGTGEETCDAPTSTNQRANTQGAPGADTLLAVVSMPANPDTSAVQDERQSVEVDDEGESMRRFLPMGSEVEASDVKPKGGDTPDGADEASYKVWSAYQRWRVTKIRLGGIINQENAPRELHFTGFPLASSIYSTVLGGKPPRSLVRET